MTGRRRMEDAYILVVRNPMSGRVIVIDDGEDGIAQFASEGEAYAAADNITICKRWGCQVVEVY